MVAARPCLGPGALVGLFWALLTPDARAEGPDATQTRDAPDTVTATERQEDPDPIQRPVPLTSLEVPYPEKGEGSARVILELLVSKEGTVSQVRVVEGRSPFREAALRAARGFRFQAARRGDQAIAAWIRIEARFAARAPDTRPEEDESAHPSSPSPPAPVEILVLGDRPPPDRDTLGRSEVRELPGAFGDPFRAVEAMPGVTPLVSGVPFFYVRGAPPGNVGYFLDGIRVPLLYHVALGPSVIHPGLIDRVDLYRGGYPARYGRFAGGIVAAETAPPEPALHGEANLRVFDAGALVEGPLGGGRGAALVGGRYSYTATILSLLAPDVTLSYWDYQGRVGYEVSRGVTLGAFAFGAFDLFRGNQEDESLGTQFHRLDLRLDLTPTPATEARLAVTLGVDRSRATSVADATGSSDRLGGSAGLQSVDADRDDLSAIDTMMAVRVEVTHHIGRRTLMHAGGDVSVDRYRTDFTDETAQALLFSRTDRALGTHADLVWQAEPGVRVIPGLRFDYYHSNGVGVPAIEPRLAAVFSLSRHVDLEHALGVAHQPPAFTVPVPGIQVSDLEDGLQESLQSSAGVRVRPGDGWELGATVFQNAFFDMTDLLGTARLRDLDDTLAPEERVDDRSLGRSYGLELSARRPLTRRLAGYFAYTLSRSTRSQGNRRALSAFDRTHVLHAAGAYDLGARWRAGARLTTYSGVPAELKPAFDDTGLLAERQPQPGARSPWFFRVDVRLEKRWPIDQEGRYWALVMEMLNATLAREVVDYGCGVEGCDGDEIGPVSVPSVGVEVFF